MAAGTVFYPEFDPITRFFEPVSTGNPRSMVLEHHVFGRPLKRNSLWHLSPAWRPSSHIPRIPSLPGQDERLAEISARDDARREATRAAWYLNVVRNRAYRILDLNSRQYIFSLCKHIHSSYRRARMCFSTLL